MKHLNLINMGFILTGLALTACENDELNTYQIPERIHADTIYTDDLIQVIQFTVNARNWRRISDTEIFTQASVPSITDSIINKGNVVIYLNEMGSPVALPFTYYQVRRATLFEPSYGPGRVYIHILGHFILNVNTNYSFQVFVVNPKGMKKHKGINWQNYEEASRAIPVKAQKKSRTTPGSKTDV